MCQVKLIKISMIKNKKGAEHVDWAISIGIFILFLLAILVYIKPVYKPTYEAETLGEMVKNSFLAENNATIYRTLVITEHKEEVPVCNSIELSINNLGNIYVTKEDLVTQAEKYKKVDNKIIFPNPTIISKYWVYYNLESTQWNINGDDNYNPKCTSNPKIGETEEYIGLRGSTSGTYIDLKNKIKGFPESKEFRIGVIKTNGEEQQAYTPSGSPTPPEDVNVYVYEFLYPLLTWGSNQPSKTNYIVSIQIW